MPIAAVTAPAVMVTRPTQAGEMGSRRNANNTIPYAPSLTTSPDKNADPSAGATGCASGRHLLAAGVAQDAQVAQQRDGIPRDADCHLVRGGEHPEAGDEREVVAGQ